jgi:probable F420-dependent oxidoreductase
MDSGLRQDRSFAAMNMKIETLLPLGKLDPGLRAAPAPRDIGTICDDARRAEALGYDGIITEETKDDPYIVMALAAQATSRVSLATAVAIAFPRSPTVTALSAWTLQRLSGGRFVLGLGSQVKGHIERRYGMRWSAPGPWLREYVQAMRAVWDCWQHGTKLDFQGEHYKLSLMVPLFAPPPIEHPHIPVELAAVNPYMCQVAGEVADGIRAHPIATPRFIAEVMLPAARKGAAKTGREFDHINGAGFTLAAMPLVATAPDRAGLPERIRDVRARVAFYASTPAYVAAFEHEGDGEAARNLQALARAQRWEEMPALVDDEMLDRYAVIGPYDEIAAKLRARYGGLATALEFAIPLADAADEAMLRALLDSLRQG